MPEITDERLAQLEAYEKREAAFRAHLVKHELTRALSAAKVRPEALADAVAILAGQCAPTFDDDGNMSGLAIGEHTFESAEKAASHFLKARAYLVQADGDEAEQPARGTKGTPSTPPAQTVTEAWATTAPKPAPVAPAAPAYTPPKPRQTSVTVDELLKSGHSAVDLVSEGWAEPPK